MKTIEQEWQAYKVACYPRGIRGVQEKETRQAFLAGALVAHAQLAKCAQIEAEDAACEAVARCRRDVIEQAAMPVSPHHPRG